MLTTLILIRAKCSPSLQRQRIFQKRQLFDPNRPPTFHSLLNEYSEKICNSPITQKTNQLSK